MSDISQIKLPDNTTYNINAKTVNGYTVGKDVPSSAVFTDQYVAQVSSATEDNDYRVLLSGTASDNTQTETVRKSAGLKFNPKYDAITIGYDRASGSAYGSCSFTQGSNIVASGQYSHGEGWWTIANHRSQHVFGEYNIADTNAASATARGDYVEIVGNGIGDNIRSNARTLDWDGTETLAGSLLLAGTTSDIYLTGTDNYWYGTTTSLKTAVSSLEQDLSDLTPLEKTASGAIASFDDGSDLPMPKLEVTIEPQQEGSGDPSPTNVRPISGWDEVNVTVCGKNFFGAKLTDFQNGTAYGLTKYIALRLPYNTYTISTNAPTGNVWVGKETPSGISDFSRIYDGTSKTVTSDILYIGLASADLETAYSYNTMIEVGSQPTTYEPYTGTTYTIDLDGTRYGGTLDVVSGELVVTDGYIASYNGETLPSTWISDRDVYAEGSTPTTGAEVCYKLATPLTIQLTPTQVKSLLGVNNIWADTGDVDIIYFRNAKSTQAIRDVIDTTTAKDIAFTKYKGLPTNVQEAINKTYDNVVALNGNIADYYLERQSYSVDDYVRYEDPYYGGYNLYRCIERSDGGSFDYNKWFRTNIGDELSQIRQSLSDLIQYVLIQGTTSSSGALALPSEVVSGAILDMYYEGSGVNGFINRRDKNYLTCYDNNLNIKASTAVKIHCYYTPISQS